MSNKWCHAFLIWAFFSFGQSEIGEISRTLQNWFEGCDEMLACLQDEAMRANAIKAANVEHKAYVEKKVNSRSFIIK